MRIVLLLAALVGTARADTLIASHTDDTLFIHRVTKTSITKVMEEKGGRAYAYAFAGMTLWVLRAGPSGFTLGTIARGRASAAKPVTYADFRLSAEPSLPADMGHPSILVTRGGQVWLSKCVKMHYKGRRMVCNRVYARVDDSSMRTSTKRPRDIATPGPPKAAVHRPKGYVIRIVQRQLKGHRFAGVQCTGPATQVSWPSAADLGDAVNDLRFVPHAINTTWISASPPIARVTLGGTTPVGERLNAELYVVDCKAIGDTLPPLSGGGWVLGNLLAKAGNEVLDPNGKPIGNIPGTSVVVSP